MIFSRREDANPDPGSESPPGALQWLQAWFTSNCDDEWEHGEGIRIETLDNPGWHIKIDLANTAVAGRELHPLKLERSEHDWYVIRREEDTFIAACGALNLGEVLYLFRRWVQGDQDLDATGTASLYLRQSRPTRVVRCAPGARNDVTVIPQVACITPSIPEPRLCRRAQVRPDLRARSRTSTPRTPRLAHVLASHGGRSSILRSRPTWLAPPAGGSTTASASGARREHGSGGDDFTVIPRYARSWPPIILRTCRDANGPDRDDRPAQSGYGRNMAVSEGSSRPHVLDLEQLRTALNGVVDLAIDRFGPMVDLQAVPEYNDYYWHLPTDTAHAMDDDPGLYVDAGQSSDDRKSWPRCSPSRRTRCSGTRWSIWWDC